jgi:hypothetical protein
MVDRARDAGLTHVIIKIADGASAYNVDLVNPATDAFKAAGIQVWGWAWLWMREPFQEAEIAAHRTRTLALDGFVINAEYPAKGKAQEAEAYMDTLRDQLPDTTLALSSYRHPQFHSSLPWDAFLSRCDLNMPQMYWVGEEPANCVSNSIARHQDFGRPIIPTGAAYGEYYGSSYFRSSPSEIAEFLDTVRANGLPAANFWSWDWVDANAPDLWEAIADYEWPGAVAPVADIGEQFWEALSSRDLDSLTALYHSDAVYITAGHAVQGTAAIRAKFRDLLDLLPDTQFFQDELIIERNVRFIRWSADPLKNGLDTLGIRAGKIQYHSSSYQLEME